MAYEPGVCGFCGCGGGYLGDQGDESSHFIHGAVRVGEPGDWEYEPHPNSTESGSVLWCGTCEEGLAHKYQRYDDRNLDALWLSSKFRLELDGLRWGMWDAVDGEQRAAAKKYSDDVAVHMEKLRVRNTIDELQEEIWRRARK